MSGYAGVNTLDGYEELKNYACCGFASKYLQECVYSKSDYEIDPKASIFKTKSDDKIDIQVYTKLVQLDSKLGTTASEQLYWLLDCSLRLDLLKV